MHWWERFQGRLEAELAALDAAGFAYRLDNEAERAGIIKLNVTATIDDRVLELEVLYPDLYPFFRCEIIARGENLPYHQHPASKHLCLLGRESGNWDQDFTAAYLIQNQVPKTLKAGSSHDRIAVEDIEQHQAEPFSDYYHYGPGLILVQSDWVIDPNENGGNLVIGLANNNDPEKAILRGCVLEMRGNSGRVLAEAHRALRDTHQAGKLYGRWIRTGDPIAIFDPIEFYDTIVKADLGAKNNTENSYAEGKIRIWGVLFKEQLGWPPRDVDGWTFAIRFDRVLPFAPPGSSLSRPKKQRKS